MSDFWLFLKLGLFHVLDWNAYDHILFLMVLTIAFSVDSWKKILLLVSLFTVGHTTSLALSAYDVIKMNTEIVEFLIPCTILITALFTIFTVEKKSDSKRGILYISTVFFGLIHGLGFSTYFEMISSSENNKIIPLLEFSLGIELAQILIAVGVLLLSFLLQTIFRFTKRDCVLILSSIVIGMVIPMIAKSSIW